MVLLFWFVVLVLFFLLPLFAFPIPPIRLRHPPDTYSPSATRTLSIRCPSTASAVRVSLRQ